ncbi:hypothetical protein BURCENBC7_AP1833 [Burkholderia cenocepacia BC7]|nr:uncharacterized protein BCN122_II2594 [Burkholderia cenocepacia]EPZ90019.1 hypothetical protein BURCENK562V_C4393 [Burkholderia cenocepacia K56-2Valvano]ERI32385.1 hypothetical protein BURCENBC7_AP1833 [Burkholderia cenocepacia BC7]ESS40224.1 hypothetical protein P355_2978 [Burkholderia cenocepacia KC-01]
MVGSGIDNGLAHGHALYGSFDGGSARRRPPVNENLSH